MLCECVELYKDCSANIKLISRCMKVITKSCLAELIHVNAEYCLCYTFNNKDTKDQMGSRLY